DSNLPPESNAPSGYGAPPPPPSFVRPPPVITPVSGPRPARKGGGWKVFAIILLVVLALSLLMNFGQVVSSVTGHSVRSSHAYGPRLEEVTVRDNNSSQKIAVIPIEGIITGDAIDGSGFSMVSLIKQQLKRAREDS